MTPAQTSSAIREYIHENFLYMRPDVVVADDDSLLGQGIVDSMGVIELVTFLQDQFGIVLMDDDITEDNLGSIAAMTAFVTARRDGQQAA